ncbi:energy transducer TonB [Pseudochryseolinea flava]|uniref:TonB C-terminal domain-containing protein n=1 Tax=Pseudochryseolinea flava TaxID=2059302 RepID=A0A364Y7C5_9BACT|nr:energy transducer TonB [Pseudochryseolinea flava]RAW02971.1 hypothetical protein DQQ10_02380 [Pseudochryseolinea flava]
MRDLKDDIDKYLRGELSYAERNALERKALQDPFLAEALEGASSIDVQEWAADLSTLQKSLQQRVEHKPKVIPLWTWTLRIAAGLLLVIIGSFVVWQFTDNEDQLLSKNEATKQKPSEEHKKESLAPQNNAAQPSAVVPDTFFADTKPLARSYSLQDKRMAEADLQKDVAAELAVRENDREPVAAAPPAHDQIASDSTLTLEPKPVESLAGRTSDDEIAPASRSNSGIIHESKKAKAETEQSPDQITIRGYATQLPSADGSTQVIIGKVTDAEDGDGLPGVNVLVKGTNYGTVTDGEGNYKLNVDEINPSLVFSFIGMESKEVKVNQENEVNVAMVNDMTQLNEIVVVGYGAEKVEEDPDRLEFATPMGGRAEFKKYLEGNMRYPQQALTNEIEGKVTIQFTVQASGDLSDFRVVRGIGYGCDDEVMRLIKNGPKWTPTRKGGEPVAGKMRVKVRFRLPK